MQDQLVEEKKWKMFLKTWKQRKAIVKQQIAGIILDLLFMKIHGNSIARSIWKAFIKDFQNRSQMVLVNLC
jgi:hypothetical protein